MWFNSSSWGNITSQPFAVAVKVAVMPKSSPSPDALAAIEKAAALAAAVAEKNAQKGNDDDDEQKQANLDKKLAVAKEKAR